MIYNLILTFLLLTAGALCVQISRADFSRRIIPDVYLFPLLLIGLIIVSGFDWVVSPTESAIAATFGYFSGVVIGYLFEKKTKSENIDYPPIGMGDIKLLAVGGVWLGMTGLAIAIVVSCALGFIWGRIKKQKFIPFAPFFFMGAFCALITMLFLI